MFGMLVAAGNAPLQCIWHSGTGLIAPRSRLAAVRLWRVMREHTQAHVHTHTHTHRTKPPVRLIEDMSRDEKNTHDLEACRWMLEWGRGSTDAG